MIFNDYGEKLCNEKVLPLKEDFWKSSKIQIIEDFETRQETAGSGGLFESSELNSRPAGLFIPDLVQ